MNNLLQGVKIIELGHILLGPYAGQLVADMGADVIKIEALEGDFYRTVGVNKTEGMGAQWLNTNRNKRSVSLDLKSSEGKEVLTQLLKEADAVFHNMRPQALERLGFDYDSVKKINPSIVYCASAGFGQDGPYKDYPAFDDIIQAYSGMADLNGITGDNTPKFTPLVMTDHIAGLMLAQAILGGLYHQKSTGNGCFIELPMLEATVTVLLNQHLNGHVFNPPVGDIGYKRVLSPDRKPCKTKDGYIVHGVYTFKHWHKLLSVIGMHEMLEHEWLRTESDLAKNISHLYKFASETIFVTRTTDEWMTLLQSLDIPCAPVKSIFNLKNDPHLQAVGLFEKSEHPTEGTLTVMRSPFVMKDVEKKADRHAPNLGEHTIEVLKEIGLSDEQVSQLISKGVVSDSSLRD